MLIYRPPQAVLAPFVEGMWFYRSAHDHPREVILPNGRSQLFVNLDTGHAFVRGISTRPVAVDPAEMRHMVGVLFRPEGAFSITGVSGLELQDGAALLTDLIRHGGAELAPRLTEALADPVQVVAELEAWLIERQPAATTELQMIAAATRVLEAQQPVAAAVKRAGASRSSLLRHFGTHVGATPKQYARVHRFQRVVHALAGGQQDLAQIALLNGYSDQAHLCHEFRAFAERSPTAYRPRDPSEPNHVVD